jgi:MobA/MobL family
MSLVRFAIKHHSQTGQGAPSALHAAYILRDAQYGKTRAQVDDILRKSASTRGREDLVYREAHKLPRWAEGSPAKSFDVADQFEGANRRVSTTLEVALPRELPRAQQIALMQDFCHSQFGEKLPYAVALHESHTRHGGVNPHFHVIWSTRITDEVERTPAQHFKRPNWEYPAHGGAAKDPLFHERGHVAA